MTATPRKPQDRMPKASDSELTVEPATTPEDKPKTVEWEGHSYEIDPARIDNLDFFEVMEAAETRGYLLARLVRMMLGEEQYEAFKRNHADDQGRISSSRVGEFYNDAMKQVNEGN